MKQHREERCSLQIEENSARTGTGRISHHTSRSGRALLTVPPHSTLDGFSKRRRSLAERPLEPGVIYDERFLELVEHLDRLADARVEQT
jgi:hypothetical protein